MLLPCIYLLNSASCASNSRLRFLPLAFYIYFHLSPNENCIKLQENSSSILQFPWGRKSIFPHFLDISRYRPHKYKLNIYKQYKKKFVSLFVSCLAERVTLERHCKLSLFYFLHLVHKTKKTQTRFMFPLSILFINIFCCCLPWLDDDDDDTHTQNKKMLPRWCRRSDDAHTFLGLELFPCSAASFCCWCTLRREKVIKIYLCV